MRLIFKLLVLATVVYAVATAPLSDKLVMLEGAKAFGRSLQDACTRPGSPCTQGVHAIGSIVGRAVDNGRREDDRNAPRPLVRELDGTPKTAFPDQRPFYREPG